MSTLQIFSQLGVTYELQEQDLIIESPGFEAFYYNERTLDAGNSGTTARLLMGVLAKLNGKMTLTGDESLSKRPMKRVTRTLRANGGSYYSKVILRYQQRLQDISSRGLLMSFPLQVLKLNLLSC